MSIAVLVPVLAQIGAPFLKRLLEKEAGGAVSEIGGVVIDALATKLGVEKTPEAIAAKHAQDPKAVTDAAAAVESELPDMLPYMVQAVAGRDALLAREDTKGFFHSGWRPAMSWLVIFLFGWAMFLAPVINTAFRSTIPIPNTEDIIQLAGIWLVIYGGGHTIKEVWGRK